jgi:hypothetical protein
MNPLCRSIRIILLQLLGGAVTAVQARAGVQDVSNSLTLFKHGFLWPLFAPPLCSCHEPYPEPYKLQREAPIHSFLEV